MLPLEPQAPLQIVLPARQISGIELWDKKKEGSGSYFFVTLQKSI